MRGPFLHLVQYNVEPEGENAFNEWYNIHTLHVLTNPGHVWCRRYVAIHGDVKYLTLYMIENEEAYRRILVHNKEDRLPILKNEPPQESLTGLHHICSNVYEQVWGSNLGSPLLSHDNPLMLVVSDGPPDGHVPEWNEWYNRCHIPAVLRDSSRVMAARFRAVDGAVPPYYPVGPLHITIYELLGEEAVDVIQNPDRWSLALREANESAEARKYRSIVRNWDCYFYKPISTHWAY